MKKGRGDVEATVRRCTGPSGFTLGEVVKGGRLSRLPGRSVMGSTSDSVDRRPPPPPSTLPDTQTAVHAASRPWHAFTHNSASHRTLLRHPPPSPSTPYLPFFEPVGLLQALLDRCRRPRRALGDDGVCAGYRFSRTHVRNVRRDRAEGSVRLDTLSPSCSCPCGPLWVLVGCPTRPRPTCVKV